GRGRTGSLSSADMSNSVKQALVLAVGGVLIALFILRLARRRLLTTRYAVGWLVVGLIVALAAVSTPFVGKLGRFAGITPTGVLLIISSVVLLAISIQLSVSVSLLQERLRSTAEAHALLARKVEDLERSQSTT